MLLCGFGLIGYFMRRNGYPVAPVILGFVLGGRMETALRQSMIMTQGDVLRMVERPIVDCFLVLALLAMAAPIVLARLRFRGQRIELERDES